MPILYRVPLTPICLHLSDLSLDTPSALHEFKESRSLIIMLYISKMAHHHADHHHHHSPAEEKALRNRLRKLAGQMRAIEKMIDQHTDCSEVLTQVKKCGGIAIVQDPEDADHPSMPRSALRQTKVDYCLPLKSVGPKIAALVGERHSGHWACRSARTSDTERSAPQYPCDAAKRTAPGLPFSPFPSL